MRFAILLCVLAMGCPSSTNPDGGMDSGARDAPAVDVGPGADAGPGDDAGPTLDAGPGTDTGPVADGGPAMDAPAADAGGPDGGPVICTAEMLCGGACTGRSCGADWFCITDVGCTADVVTYCGCDGTTFTGSSTCPSRPYASMGPCTPADGLRCDRRGVVCRAPEPACEFGFVPEVDESGTCWTFRCVPIGECGCSTPEECSDTNNYTCRRGTNRCTPFL